MSTALQIYEVVGVPGAGKTTFIAQSISGRWQNHFLDLDAALVGIISRRSPKSASNARAGTKKESEDLRKLHRSFVRTHFYNSVGRFESLVEFIARHSPYAQNVIAAIEETSDPDERQLMLTWLFNLFAKYQHVTSSENDGRSILMDEGFIARVNTLFAYRAEPPVDKIRNYVKLAPKPDAVIRLNVDLEECYARLSNRSKGPPARFRSFSQEQQFEILKKCHHCLEIALTELSAAGLRVIEIDSGRTPQEQVAAAASALGLRSR